MKKIIIYLLTLAFTTFLITLFFEYFNNQTLNSYHDLKYWINKIENKPVDIIFLGDSRIYRAINNKIFENNLNKTSLNFAFNTNTYTKNYLNYAFHKINKNGIVFLGISPQSLTNYESDKHFIEIKSNTNSFFLKYLNLIDSLVPSYSLLSIIRGYKNPFRKQQFDSKIIYHQNGWMETIEINKTNIQGAHAYESAFNHHKLNKDNIKNIISFIKKLSKKKNAKCYLFIPPTSQEVLNIEIKHTNNFNTFNRFIKLILLKTNAKLLPVDKKYRTMETFDGDHLDSKHAILFTNELFKTYKEINNENLK